MINLYLEKTSHRSQIIQNQVKQILQSSTGRSLILLIISLSCQIFGSYSLPAQTGPEFCYTPVESQSTPLGCGHPCFANINDNEIENYPIATVHLDFHFIADANGNNFHCDPNGNPNYFAPAIVQQIISRANLYFSSPDQNVIGLSPKVPDARIRYELIGNPTDACEVIFLYQNINELTYSNSDAFHIIISNQNSNSGISGELIGTERINLYNIPYAFFENGSTDAIPWGPIMNHEIGHRFGLCHSFSTDNTCQDMNPAEECGGASETNCKQTDGQLTPCPHIPLDSPYPLSCGGNICFSCYCTWGVGNNFMGANGSFRGMTISQWATMYGSMLATKPAFVTFGGLDCSDIPAHPPIEIPENTLVEWNTFRIVDRNVEVRKGATLIVHCEVNMGKDLHIIVNRGARLFVLGGRITSFSDDCRWGGIIVHGNSTKDQPSVATAKDISISLYENSPGVVWLNGATLENAHNAISTRGSGGFNIPSYYGGLVLSFDSDFINNDRAIEFMRYGKANKSSFEYCKFEKGTSTVPFPVRRGATIWGCTGIKFMHCNFTNLTESGISGIDFTSEVETCTFKGSLYGYRSETTMPNISQGITTIQNNCVFENNQTHIYSNASPNFLYGYNIIGNTFLKSTLAGIRIGGESQYFIKDANIFLDNPVSIRLAATGSYRNEVVCNYLENHRLIGIQILSSNDQLHILGNNFLGGSGLEMRFEGNPTKKASIFSSQGSVALAAGNKFLNPTNPISASQNSTQKFIYYTLPETAPEYSPDQVPTNNLSDGGTNNYELRKIASNLSTCSIPIQPNNLPTEFDLYTARQNTAIQKTVWEADSLNWEKYLSYRYATAHQDSILRYLVYEAWLIDSIIHAEDLLLGEQTKVATRGTIGLRILRGNLSGAQSLLDSIPIENQDDQWFKNIMEINLIIAQTNGEGFDLSTAQEQTLHTIAADKYSLMQGYACALLSQWRGYTCTEASGGFS